MDKEKLTRLQRDDEVDQADGSPDELEELIAEMTAKNPNFPRMLEEAIERQTLMHTLVQERKHQQITQKNLAARMATKQSTLARLEQEQRPVFRHSSGMQAVWGSASRGNLLMHNLQLI